MTTILDKIAHFYKHTLAQRILPMSKNLLQDIILALSLTILIPVTIMAGMILFYPANDTTSALIISAIGITLIMSSSFLNTTTTNFGSFGLMLGGVLLLLFENFLDDRITIALSLTAIFIIFGIGYYYHTKKKSLENFQSKNSLRDIAIALSLTILILRTTVIAMNLFFPGNSTTSLLIYTGIGICLIISSILFATNLIGTGGLGFMLAGTLCIIYRLPLHIFFNSLFILFFALLAIDFIVASIGYYVHRKQIETEKPSLKERLLETTIAISLSLLLPASIALGTYLFLPYPQYITASIITHFSIGIILIISSFFIAASSVEFGFILGGTLCIVYNLIYNRVIYNKPMFTLLLATTLLVFCIGLFYKKNKKRIENTLRKSNLRETALAISLTILIPVTIATGINLFPKENTTVLLIGSTIGIALLISGFFFTSHSIDFGIFGLIVGGAITTIYCCINNIPFFPKTCFYLLLIETLTVFYMGYNQHKKQLKKIHTLPQNRLLEISITLSLAILLPATIALGIDTFLPAHSIISLLIGSTIAISLILSGFFFLTKLSSAEGLGFILGGTLGIIMSLIVNFKILDAQIVFLSLFLATSLLISIGFIYKKSSYINQ